MAPISSYAYTPIPVNLDHGKSEPYHLQEGLNENSTSDLELRDRRRQLFLVVLTSLSLLCLMILSMALGHLTVTNSDCGRQLSTWSPAFEAVEYYQTTFEGEFLAPSVWRGPPFPELDEAWNRISIRGTGSLRIAKYDLSRLNKSADAEITAGFGDGTNDVQVLLEVFHQLHCLNEIRKHTWPEYYKFDAPPKVERAHLDHCIEMLRINLMCTADMTPITAKQVSWKNGDAAPDFSTLHTCRDFSKILKHVEDHADLWGFWAS
ncbi:Cyclochlorotine biosynthesis protein O [Metarhizium brunneum]|uniref:Cyclochlorotine biosynthesis protein O n=1 Tax=Metarhizium brunneum TaxID=500148 RepID=A0A7D5Z2N9_9HYPO|nr:Cyclochlorotine biosynthesis protein O [Metarhizium brunneum]